jgi:hypothetical protein
MSVFQYTDRGFPIVVAMGEYEREELHAALERTFATLRDKPAAGMLIDARESVPIRRRTSAEIRSTAMTIASGQRHFSGRVAVVATTEATFGLIRMGVTRSLIDGLETQLFRDYERAMAWLATPVRMALDVDQSA